MELDKCKCGRTKKVEDVNCYDCFTLKLSDAHAAVTTGRCEKHNKFWSTGSSCPDCLQEAWIKTAAEPKPEQEILKMYHDSGESLRDKLGDLIPEPVNLTGQSARYNTGKVQVREVDPAFILGIGEVLTASRAKYDEGNWMKETKLSTPYESCMRHMMKFWAGEEMDDETKKHHLLHAATNLMFLYYHLDSGKGIDDRLFKKDKK